MRRSLAQLAREVGGESRGNPETAVEGISTLEAAGPTDLSFYTNPRYRERAQRSRAGILLVGPESGIEGRDLLVAAEPAAALAQLIELFHPAPAAPPPGTHPTAVVDPAAAVDATASVGAYVVVGPRCRIGAGVVLHPHVVLGADCEVGRDSILHPHVVLYAGTQIGARCTVHSGAILGSDGFGFASGAGGHRKIPQVGRVVVEDDVEVGANCTLDRATLGLTRIGAGSKFDNLVHVGHNAEIGRDCLLVAHVGISGSTRLGRGVVMGGQSGVAGHLEVGDGVQVAAKSAVLQSVEAGRRVAGIPAVEIAAWRRQQALARRIGDLRSRLLRLERRMARGAEEEGSD